MAIVGKYLFENDANDATGNSNGTASNVTYQTGVSGLSGKGNGNSSGAGTSKVTVPVVAANRIGASNGSWGIRMALKKNINYSSHYGTITSGRGSGTADTTTFPFELYFNDVGSTNDIISADLRKSGTNRSCQYTDTGNTLVDGKWHRWFIEWDNGNVAMYMDNMATPKATQTYTASNDYRKPLAENYEIFTNQGATADGVSGDNIDELEYFDAKISTADRVNWNAKLLGFF